MDNLAAVNILNAGFVQFVLEAEQQYNELAIPFLGGMMITRMQDGYDVCHNCCGVRLHSLKRRTRMRTGRNVLFFFIAVRSGRDCNYVLNGLGTR